MTSDTGSALTKRYLIVPGVVFSEYDGQRHYLDAVQLMLLYGVRPDECVVWGSGGPYEYLIRLAPRADGDYHLPPAPMCPECDTLLRKYGGSRITWYCGNEGCTRFAVRIVDAPRGPARISGLVAPTIYYCDNCDRTYDLDASAEMCRCSMSHWHYL